MLLKIQVKVKGIEKLADAQPGKPAFRVSLEGIEERKIVGSTEVEMLSGNAKSYVQLEPGSEYLCECVVGAYKSGDKALPYLQIRKVLKGGSK